MCANVVGVGEVRALVDSGASVSAITIDMVKHLLKGKGSTHYSNLRGIDNRTVDVIDELELQIVLYGSNVTLSRVVVIRSAPFSLILGSDWIVASGARLQGSPDKIKISFPRKNVTFSETLHIHRFSENDHDAEGTHPSITDSPETLALIVKDRCGAW